MSARESHRRPRFFTILSCAIAALLGAAWIASYWWPVIPPRGISFGRHAAALARGRLLIFTKTDPKEAEGMEQAVDVGSSVFFETSVHEDTAAAKPLQFTVTDSTTLPATMQLSGSYVGATTINAVSTVSSTPFTISGRAATLIFPPAVTYYFPGVARFDQWGSGLSLTSLTGMPPSYLLSTSGTLTISGGGTLGVLRAWSVWNIGLWLIMTASLFLPILSLIGAISAMRDRRAARRLGLAGPVIRVSKPAASSPLRRFIGAAITLIVIASSTLSLLSAATWIWSERTSRTYTRGTYPEDSLRLLLANGELSGSRNKIRPGRYPEIYHERYIFHLTCGLSTYTGPNFYSWSFRIPMWVPTALTSLPAIGWLILRPARVRRGRAMRGLCSACAYDLRMTPDRCPECGVSTVVV